MDIGVFVDHEETGHCRQVHEHNVSRARASSPSLSHHYTKVVSVCPPSLLSHALQGASAAASDWANRKSVGGLGERRPAPSVPKAGSPRAGRRVAGQSTMATPAISPASPAGGAVPGEESSTDKELETALRRLRRHDNYDDILASVKKVHANKVKAMAQSHQMQLWELEEMVRKETERRKDTELNCGLAVRSLEQGQEKDEGGVAAALSHANEVAALCEKHAQTLRLLESNVSEEKEKLELVAAEARAALQQELDRSRREFDQSRVAALAQEDALRLELKRATKEEAEQMQARHTVEVEKLEKGYRQVIEELEAAVRAREAAEKRAQELEEQLEKSKFVTESAHELTKSAEKALATLREELEAADEARATAETRATELAEKLLASKLAAEAALKDQAPADAAAYATLQDSLKAANEARAAAEKYAANLEEQLESSNLAADAALQERKVSESEAHAAAEARASDLAKQLSASKIMAGAALDTARRESAELHDMFELGIQDLEQKLEAAEVEAQRAKEAAEAAEAREAAILERFFEKGGSAADLVVLKKKTSPKKKDAAADTSSGGATPNVRIKGAGEELRLKLLARRTSLETTDELKVATPAKVVSEVPDHTGTETLEEEIMRLQAENARLRESLTSSAQVEQLEMAVQMANEREMAASQAASKKHQTEMATTQSAHAKEVDDLKKALEQLRKDASVVLQGTIERMTASFKAESASLEAQVSAAKGALAAAEASKAEQAEQDEQGDEAAALPDVAAAASARRSSLVAAGRRGSLEPLSFSRGGGGGRDRSRTRGVSEAEEFEGLDLAYLRELTASARTADDFPPPMMQPRGRAGVDGEGKIGAGDVDDEAAAAATAAEADLIALLEDRVAAPYESAAVSLKDQLLAALEALSRDDSKGAAATIDAGIARLEALLRGEGHGDRGDGWDDGDKASKAAEEASKAADLAAVEAKLSTQTTELEAAKALAREHAAAIEALKAASAGSAPGSAPGSASGSAALASEERGRLEAEVADARAQLAAAVSAAKAATAASASEAARAADAEKARSDAEARAAKATSEAAEARAAAEGASEAATAAAARAAASAAAAASAHADEVGALRAELRGLSERAASFEAELEAQAEAVRASVAAEMSKPAVSSSGLRACREELTSASGLRVTHLCAGSKPASRSVFVKQDAGGGGGGGGYFSWKGGGGLLAKAPPKLPLACLVEVHHYDGDGEGEVPAHVANAPTAIVAATSCVLRLVFDADRAADAKVREKGADVRITRGCMHHTLAVVFMRGTKGHNLIAPAEALKPPVARVVRAWFC